MRASTERFDGFDKLTAGGFDKFNGESVEPLTTGRLRAKRRELTAGGFD
jgi:hypothetical protein